MMKHRFPLVTLVIGVLFFLGGIALFLGSIFHGVSYIIPAKPYVCFRDGEMLTEASHMALRPRVRYVVYDTMHKYYKKGQVIVRRVCAYKIKNGNTFYWVSKDIYFQNIIDDDGNRCWVKAYSFGKDTFFLAIIWILTGLLLVSLAYLIPNRTSHYMTSFSIIYILVYFLGISIFFYYNGFFIIDCGDPDQFVSIAKEWYLLNRHTPIPNQVGGAFFYLPLMLLFQADRYLPIAIPFSLFNLSISALNIFLVLLIIREFTKSTISFHLCGILSSMLPVFTFAFSCGGRVDRFGLIGKTGIFLGTVNPYSVVLFNKSLVLGWNGYVGTLAVFFILIGLLSLMKCKSPFLKYILLGLSLGFAMTLRYGVITILPAIFYIDILLRNKCNMPWKRFLLFYVLFGVSGFIGFLPQFVDNFYVNGNPLTPTALNRLPTIIFTP